MNEEPKKLIAKEVWASPERAKSWLERVERRAMTIEPSTNNEILSIPMLIKEIKNTGFKSFLEIGAGNGRLIGNIKKSYPDSDCNSVDINKDLSAYVKEQYPEVNTFVSDAADLSIFKDNSFDLVFTFQVLQHVPPEEMENVLKEIRRVTRKEFWLMEGHDPEYKHCPNGFMRKGTDGGSFVWRFDEILNCYETKIPPYGGIKFYKIKK